MKNIKIADVTLREDGRSYNLSFKEKIEIAKILDKLHIDVVETNPIIYGKRDILFLHRIVPLIRNSVLSCPVTIDKDMIKNSVEAIKDAKHPRINLSVPVSTVQMEYIQRKKPKAMLEELEDALKYAKSLISDIEVSLIDATRAEKDFLYSAAKLAAECGATVVNICDTAGEMLPSEFSQFLSELLAAVPELSGVEISAECSDNLNMASACAISCIAGGVTQIKTAVAAENSPSLLSIAHIFRAKSDSLGISSCIDLSCIDNSAARITDMLRPGSKRSPFDSGTNTDTLETISLSSFDDISYVADAVKKLGYVLPEEDIANVFEELSKISKNKTIGIRELEAIVASVAMQVEPTYKLKSYVMNNGNIITPTAHIELEKDGETLSGICLGDGPIDAAFLAIEQITGHHFELDDYQVQAVTEGQEAMGSSIVKLRYNGKSFSGKGISTDIIGASIKAYINALNKVCFEEENI